MNKIIGMFNHTKKFAAFSNIAEGTHAGCVSLKAAEDINNPYLLVKLDDSGEAVVVCAADELPIGVCADECDINENVAVMLAGSAESSFLCKCATDVDAGDTLYSYDGGKVSNVSTSGCYKIGVALTSAQTDALVEVDTQGFGTRPSQISDSGVYDWQASDTEEILEASVSEDDIVIASIAQVGANEKSVSAQIVENGIKFVLDSAGSTNTKVSWIIVRK